MVSRSRRIRANWLPPEPNRGQNDVLRKGVCMPWPDERDTELFELLDREFERQNSTLQLIASENFTSPAVLEATGSVLNE